MTSELITNYRNVDNVTGVITLHCCDTELWYMHPASDARPKIKSLAVFSNPRIRDYYLDNPREFDTYKASNPHTRLCYIAGFGGTLYDLECEDNPTSIITTLSLLLLDLNPNSGTQRQLAMHLAQYVHRNKHKLNPKDVAPAIRALSDVKYLVDEEHNKRLRNLQELKQEDYKYFNSHYKSILESVCFTAGG